MRAAALVAVAAAARVALLAYGEYQDATMVVKYTDIDYRVFSDAAAHVAAGASPFDRATYRYTPLLAWMLVPNAVVWRSFGKVLFAAVDLVCGALLIAMGRRHLGLSAERATVYAAVWLLNPFAATISTRGNAESLVCALVLLALFFVLERRPLLAGLFYGLAVHFKLYPIIYALLLLLAMGPARGRQAVFALTSALVFVAVTGAMYWLYGWPALYEGYLYHFVRSDTRHNFSPFFYWLYLAKGRPMEGLLSMAAFVPQIVANLATTGYYLRKPTTERLVTALFVATTTFVALNKVCTSQYFLWFQVLLPLVLPRAGLSVAKGVSAFALWMAGQAVWLWFAYHLEFEGENRFTEIWLAGLALYVETMLLLVWLVRRLEE